MVGLNKKERQSVTGMTLFVFDCIKNYSFSITLSTSPYLRFGCGHEVIAVGIPFDLLKRLSCVRQDVVQLIAHLQDMLGANFDVAGLAFSAAERLVNHDFAVRQCVTFAFAPAASRNAPMEAAMPTQIVDTSGLMNCIVSNIAIPAVTEPPGLLM